MNTPSLDAIKALIDGSGTYTSVHGNGFIQCKLSGGPAIHLWGHPEIPCQVVPSFIHNHRFGVKSRVLFGRIVDVRYKLLHGPVAYNMYGVQHQEGTQNTTLELMRNSETGNPSVVHPSPKSAMSVKCVDAGQEYTVPPSDFHESIPRGLTITYVQKFGHRPSIIPTVLSPVGVKPDNRFHRDAFDTYALVSEFFRACKEQQTIASE